MVKFFYDIEHDLKNYENSWLDFKYPFYGREKLVVTNFLSPSFVKKVEETKGLKNQRELCRQRLEKFQADKATYIELQIDTLSRYWKTIEPQYISRLEKYFGLIIDFGEVNCYLTTLTISPYNYKEKSFMTSINSGLAGQINTIMHEFMHLVFLNYFRDYCIEKGVNEQGILEINESLTALLNYEFFDLLITPAYNNKPTTVDLQRKVRELWKEKKPFPQILNELIKMRL